VCNFVYFSLNFLYKTLFTVVLTELLIDIMRRFGLKNVNAGSNCKQRFLFYTLKIKTLNREKSTIKKNASTKYKYNVLGPIFRDPKSNLVWAIKKYKGNAILLRGIQLTFPTLLRFNCANGFIIWNYYLKWCPYICLPVGVRCAHFPSVITTIRELNNSCWNR
jgi:hypothetical protein